MKILTTNMKIEASPRCTMNFLYPSLMPLCLQRQRSGELSMVLTFYQVTGSQRILQLVSVDVFRRVFHPQTEIFSDRKSQVQWQLVPIILTRTRKNIFHESSKRESINERDHFLTRGSSQSSIKSYLQTIEGALQQFTNSEDLLPLLTMQFTTAANFVQTR